MQDVDALPSFTPHGGPITHSSTGSKPDSPIHPMFLRLFLACDLVCNSWATFLVTYSGIRRNTYPHCSEHLFTPCFRHRTVACSLETSHEPHYFALDIFLNFNSRVTFCHLPRWYRPIVNLVEVRSPGIPPHSFVSMMEPPKKGYRLYLDDLKRRNEDINVLDRPLREEQARMRRPASFVTKPSPLSLPLKSRDEISCSGGELWRPDNHATVISC